MKALEAIAQAALDLARGETVSDVRVGLGYSAVLLDDGRAGVAYTMQRLGKECCSVLDDAGALRGISARDMVGWALSENPVRVTLGVAAINALAKANHEESSGDISDFIDAGRGDCVGMVGLFHPLLKLRYRVERLMIFEERVLPEEDLFPADAAPAMLPDCSVVVITAVALMNGTFDRLMDYCRNAREIALTGPSTPLYPEVFRDYGVKILAGVRVRDALRLMQVIAEAGGTRHFGASVDKVAVRIS